MPRRFFTDITTDASQFCLLNIKRYHDPRKATKTLCYVDPSVYELKTGSEYSKIDALHHLAQGGLAENEYLSIDYPCDMNPAYSDEFIARSIQNNLVYKDNPHYICTVQSKFQDYADFKTQFEYLEARIDFTTKIIGIGNLCRIMRPNTFTEYVFAFLRSGRRHYHYHFYGLSLALMKKYLGAFPTWSVDSTKWTRAVNAPLKAAHGVCCRKATRDLYFHEYLRVLRETFPDLEA